MTLSGSLSRKLETSVVLPNISPLTDRRQLQVSGYDSVASTLEKNGFTVGWDDGALQVGGTPTHSGFATPTNTHHEPAYRPRNSGFLSFNKVRDPQGRPRTSASFTFTPPAKPGSPLTTPLPRRETTSRERFTRLSASVDSPAPAVLHSAGGGAARAPTGTGQFSGGGAVADAHHHPQQLDTFHAPSGWHPAASTSNATLPSSSQVAAHMGVRIPAQNLRASERPGGGTPHGSTARTSSIIQVPLGIPSPSSPQSQAAAFRASRGHALMVFNELDSDKNGKVTRSEMEAAALSLGFSLEQAQRLWDRLDTRRRGFLEPPDWGSRETSQQIQLFSTRFLQKFMGYPDVSSTPEQVRKYWRTQELMQVKSLPAAVNLVRANAIARGMQSAGATGNAIYDTFRFMDVDSSGCLSQEEIKDAFFALGVYLSEPVVEQIMKVFDKDGSGNVQYHEFERTMFPIRGG